jgi:hypothetical protein
MTNLLYGQEDRLLPWAAEKIGIPGFRTDAKTIGVERDGEVSAVAVYDCFSPADCNVHLASDGSKRWMTKEFLVAGFVFPFVQCGFKSITGLVPANRADVLAFDYHIGWSYVGIRHDCMPGGGDLVILEMLRARCKFIPEEFRQ